MPLFEVPERPPEPLLHRCSDQDGVVAFADVVLVRRESGRWKRNHKVVGLVYFLEEHPVVLFFQLQVLFLVLRISQIL